MVRPKASEENLKVALGFANAVTTSCSNVNDKGRNVNCKGSASIFAALSQCLPLLVRCSKPTDPKDRHAMSEMELNKYLAHNGYTRLRCRSRIPGTSHGWNKEYLRWKFVRWMNPNEPEDLDMLKSRLVELIKCYPCTSSLDQDSLILFLSKVCSSNPESSDSGSEGAMSLSRPNNNSGGHYDFQPLPYPWRIPLRFMQSCSIFVLVSFMSASRSSCY